MRSELPAEGLDAQLSRAETTVAKLSDSQLPLEELVAAHEEAGRLVAGAEARLAVLAEQAGHKPPGPPG